MPARKAERILEKYFDKIRFVNADFYDGNFPTFSACLTIELPKQMLRDYAAFRNIDFQKIAKAGEVSERFLMNFRKETDLTFRLTKHKDARRICGHESPVDMLDYLQGNNIIMEYKPLSDLNSENVLVEIYDLPDCKSFGRWPLPSENSPNV